MAYNHLDEAVSLVQKENPRTKETYAKFVNCFRQAPAADKPKIGDLLEAFLNGANDDLTSFVMQSWNKDVAVSE